MKSTARTLSGIQEYAIELENAKEPVKDSRARAYCFTLNNYTEEEYQSIINTKYDYIVVGKEVGESGTPHLQGFVYQSNKLRWSSLKKLMPRAWICQSFAKGKKQQLAWEYCMKEGNFFENGTPPTQGKRTDLAEFRESVDEGERNRLTLMREHGEVYAKYPNYVNEYLQRTRIESIPVVDIELNEWEKVMDEELAKEPVDRRIVWIWSADSRTGKSTYMKYVSSKLKDKYLCTDDLNKRNILHAYDEQTLIHIDLTRDQTPEQRTYLKSTLESLSDQKIQFSGKYQSILKYVKAHIVVTANQPPVDGLPFRYLECRILNTEGAYEITNWQTLVTGGLFNYYDRTEYRKILNNSQWSLIKTRVREEHAQYMSIAPNNLIKF